MPNQIMKKVINCLFLIFFLFQIISCEMNQENADLIVHNGIVYTVDSLFTTAQAFAVKDGKIICTGTNKEILNKYESAQILDAQGKTIFPGFIDAHCHFFGYGIGLQQVDLTGTKSFSQVLERVVDFAKTTKSKWIIGRGWDQNDWEVKEYPDRIKLDSLFPNTPVFLERIDGHAALVNGYAFNMAAIGNTTKISGGEILHTKNKSISYTNPNNNFEWKIIPINDLTGILIDNAVDLVKKVIPPPTKEEMKTGLLAAQIKCFGAGLTTVDDAGLMKNEIDFIDSLQKSGELKMRIYAMLSDSATNYDFYLQHGCYKTNLLNVCSFKFYADGALGSRGACMKENYEDKKNWKGFLLNSIAHYNNLAQKLSKTKFQMNTHSIGDSSFGVILKIYSNHLCNATNKKLYKETNQSSNRRWRIEHAQVVNFNDLTSNKFFIPSVQPTHATSDMYWAKNRIGKKRMKNAYAYKTLLKNSGVIALGTDFPVEDISPIKTFYAAVFRKDAKGFPAAGFQMEEALTREETIRGMTIWAAYANFEEKEKGSIEKGKFADFIILDTDLMKADEKNILATKVLYTFSNGDKVYEKNKK